MAKPFSISQELLKEGISMPKVQKLEIMYVNSSGSANSEFINVHNEDSKISARLTAKGPLGDSLLWKTVKGISLNMSDKGMKKTNVTEFHDDKNNEPKIPTIDSISVDWIRDFQCTEALQYVEDAYTYNKLFAKISSDDDVMDFFGLMTRGVRTFVYDFQSSGPTEHHMTWNRFLRAKDFLGKIRKVPISCCIMPQICGKRLLTGELKKCRSFVKLTAGEEIIITSDRKSGKKGTTKCIYVNCRNILKCLKLCDPICIENIRLTVLEPNDIFVRCKVLVGGQLKPATQVSFGRYKISEDELSFEVLDDIEFIRNNNLTYFVLPEPVSLKYYENIKEALKPKDINTMKVLCRVEESRLKDRQLQCWLAENCRGVVINVSYPISKQAKTFMKLLYERKKAIILSCPFSKESVKSDFSYIFYYADNYFLDLDESLRLQEILLRTNMNDIVKYSYRMLSKNSVDNSSTGSDCMARAIAKTSYETDAKAILVCSTSGRMAIKISHFRPKCPIITISNNPHAVKAIQMFHNIRVAHYVTNPYLNEILKTVTRQDYLLRKLLAGLYFGICMRYLNHHDTVIFCFKILPDNAFANKMIVFELNADMAKESYAHFK